MATPTAPIIAEFAMTFLAGEDEVFEVDGVGAPVVGLELVVVGRRGFMVVVGVVPPAAVVVVVAGSVEVVPVVAPVLVEPPALLVRQLESVEVPTVKAAVCETAPVESRKVSPSEVPDGSLTTHVRDVPFCLPKSIRGLALGWLPGSRLR